MSGTIDKLASDLFDAFNESSEQKTKPYDATATVKRVDGNTAWVHIAEGVDETPVERTIDVSPGDKVKVRVSGHRAWITGNNTSPPTDDTVAEAGLQKATNAQLLANSASLAAQNAWQAADAAQASADDAARGADRAWSYADDANSAAIEAHNYADTALGKARSAEYQANLASQSALNASNAANSANVSANSALLSLSTVENVLELMTWAYEHGYYCYCASETTVTPEKAYFQLEYTQIATPIGNPSRARYYEISGYIPDTIIPILIKSTDTTVDPLKDYYEVTPISVRNPSGSPKDQGYYELVMDETLSEYVNTHLALTDKGLWLLPEGATPESMHYKVLVSSTQGYEGLTIYDNTMTPIARYGSDSMIGRADGYNLKVSGGRVSFCNHDTEVAYITNEQLYITKTVVLDEMQLSDKWKWKYDPSDDSIYLKWIGGA